MCFTGTWRRYDANIEAACEKYYSPILQHHIWTHIYKNIYCYHCNPLSPDKIKTDSCPHIDQLWKSADYAFSALIDFRKRERVLKDTAVAECNVDEVYDKYMVRMDEIQAIKYDYTI